MDQPIAPSDKKKLLVYHVCAFAPIFGFVITAPFITLDGPPEPKILTMLVLSASLGTGCIATLRLVLVRKWIYPWILFPIWAYLLAEWVLLFWQQR